MVSQHADPGPRACTFHSRPGRQTHTDRQADDRLPLADAALRCAHARCGTGCLLPHSSRPRRARVGQGWGGPTVAAAATRARTADAVLAGLEARGPGRPGGLCRRARRAGGAAADGPAAGAFCRFLRLRVVGRLRQGISTRPCAGRPSCASLDLSVLSHAPVKI
ncbi:hypothetical protein BDZ91DRAFT_724062 [Kalaharituber pfeilii]|nr:hypothetical protein BDZ91DRAFT_724062 [Kalaharituber pfeilii]